MKNWRRPWRGHGRRQPVPVREVVSVGKLTAKQMLYVQEYVNDPSFNQTQAAIRAGYSERSARRIAAENMTKPDIRAAIEAAMRERLERSSQAQIQLLNRLDSIIDTPASDAQDSDLRYASQLRAIELKGQYLGMWGKNAVNVSASVTVSGASDVRGLSDAELERIAGEPDE